MQVEWVVEELRPIRAVVRKVERGEHPAVTVDPGVFRSGDVVSFGGFGGTLVHRVWHYGNTDGERVDVLIVDELRFVRHVTHIDTGDTMREWVEDDTVDGGGWWSYSPVLAPMPVPHFEVVNVTAGMEAVCLGSMYVEGGAS